MQPGRRRLCNARKATTRDLRSVLILINGDSADTFCGGCEKDGGLLASLVLGVNKRHVRKSDETQNVAQVGFLKIESFLRGAFFIGTFAGSDDDNFLLCEKALRPIWPVTNRLP